MTRDTLLLIGGDGLVFGACGEPESPKQQKTFTRADGNSAGADAASGADVKAQGEICAAGTSHVVFVGTQPSPSTLRLQNQGHSHCSECDDDVLEDDFDTSIRVSLSIILYSENFEQANCWVRTNAISMAVQIRKPAVRVKALASVDDGDVQANNADEEETAEAVHRSEAQRSGGQLSAMDRQAEGISEVLWHEKKRVNTPNKVIIGVGYEQLWLAKCGNVLLLCTKQSK
eukprot:scaffold109403_cov30-Prasinocladus_malaysianus.AAC.1